MVSRESHEYDNYKNSLLIKGPLKPYEKGVSQLVVQRATLQAIDPAVVNEALAEMHYSSHDEQQSAHVSWLTHKKPTSQQIVEPPV